MFKIDGFNSKQKSKKKLTKLLQKTRYLPFRSSGHYVLWYFGVVSDLIFHGISESFVHSGGALKYATIRSTIPVSHGTVNSSLLTFRKQRFMEMERDRTERSYTTQQRVARTFQSRLEIGGADPLARIGCFYYNSIITYYYVFESGQLADNMLAVGSWG